MDDWYSEAKSTIKTQVADLYWQRCEQNEKTLSNVIFWFSGTNWFVLDRYETKV